MHTSMSFTSLPFTSLPFVSLPFTSLPFISLPFVSLPLQASPTRQSAGTAGHYAAPVVVLDFASLYPSVFRANNLCYTTLLHKSDVALLEKGDYTTTPTGACWLWCAGTHLDVDLRNDTRIRSCLANI